MIAEPIFPKNYEKLHKIKDIKVFFGMEGWEEQRGPRLIYHYENGSGP